MGRPERHDVDYFPFIIKDGKTLFILEDKFGCKGTGFFTNVLRFLSQKPDHHHCIADEADNMFFFSKMKCDEGEGMTMLNIMSKTGKINKKLWENHKVIASEEFLDSIHDAYSKRKNKIITIEEICRIYGEECISSGRNTQVDVVSSGEKTQSIVEYSKVKESISIKQREIFEIFYFKNLKNPEKELTRFMLHYEKTGGNDKNGNAIQSFSAAAELWKSEDVGIRTDAGLLSKWKKLYLYYKEAFGNMEDDYIPAILYGIPRWRGEDISFKISQHRAIEMHAHKFDRFQEALAVVFGKIEVLFTQF